MKKFLLIGMALAVLLPVAPAHASDAEMAAMAAQIKFLEEQLAAVKAQQEKILARHNASVTEGEIIPAPAPQASAAPAPNTPQQIATIEPAAGNNYGGHISATVGPKGFEIKNGNNDTLMRLRGYIHTDARFFMDDSTGTDDIEIRRARLNIEGEIGDFYYRVSPEFGGSSVSLQDAYAGYNITDTHDIRIGKFKPPVGMERLRSSGDLSFVESGLPTALTPSRNVGVRLAGEMLGGALSYEAGVFNGVPDGGSANSDSEDNREFAGRILAHPVSGLDIGVGGTWGEMDGGLGNTLLPSYRTAGRETFFSYNGTSFADGRNWRIAPQAKFYHGPFGVLGEYVISAQEIRNGTQTADVENHAWGVQAVWVLTGEDATWKSVSPAAPFNPRNGDWGAWEIAARYGELDIDVDVFPVFANPATAAEQAHNTGVALNWYLNNHVRMTFDYQHTNFKGGGGTATTDRNDENALLSRLGLSF